MILSIKGANAKIVDVSDPNNSKHLEELNIITPNGNIPTLTTEDFAVYRLNVIIEAIEDLYPFLLCFLFSQNSELMREFY